MTPSAPPPTTALGAVEELTDVAWDDVPVADLPAVAVELAGIHRRVEAALVVVAERLEREGNDALGAHGWASVKDFLTHVLAGRQGTGGGLLRVAAQTADLPAVRQALTAGRISLAQARVIGARAVTVPRHGGLRNQVVERLVEIATDEGRDATDLDHAFPTVLADLDPDGGVRGLEHDRAKQERAAHAARHLSFAEDALGGVRIRGYATLEDAELVKATLMPLAAPVTSAPGACGGTATGRDLHGRRVGAGCPEPGCEHDGRDPRDAGARLFDALLEGCRRLQAHDDLPLAHATTARISVTVDHDTLAQRVDGAGLLPGGQRLSAAAVRRLACDAEILPAVLGSHGQLLDVGRSQRLVTTALWLVLVLRDRHCAFPGCTRLPIACDAHHIVHWADGGATSFDNLILLCRRHHTLTHTSPWRVRLDPTTRKPVWIPPPQDDDQHHFRYHPPGAGPPSRAA